MLLSFEIIYIVHVCLYLQGKGERANPQVLRERKLWFAGPLKSFAANHNSRSQSTDLVKLNP